VILLILLVNLFNSASSTQINDEFLDKNTVDYKQISGDLLLRIYLKNFVFNHYLISKNLINKEDYIEKNVVLNRGNKADNPITIFRDGFEGIPWDVNFSINTGWLDSLYGKPHNGSHWAYSWTAGDNLTTPKLFFDNNTKLKFWYRIEAFGHPMNFELYLDDSILLYSHIGYMNDVYSKFIINLSNYSGYHNITFTGLTSDFYGQLLDDISIETNDLTVPEINNISVNPDQQTANNNVNISCEVTDNYLVNQVRLNIIDPIGGLFNISMNQIKGRYYYNSSFDEIGNYSCFIWANDTVGNNNITNFFTFKIINANTPPIINTTDVINAFEDTLYSVNYTAIDPDVSDVLSWSIVTNASFLNINSSSGLLSGIPSNEQVGSYYVNVSVSDGNGGTDDHNFTLTVINTNDPPIIETTDVTSATEDVPYFNDYQATDPDIGDILTWSLVSDAVFLGIDSGSGVLSGIAGDGDVGVFFVNVSVSDGHGGVDFHNFSLTVSNTNDAPVACFTWKDLDGIGSNTTISFNASCSTDDFGITLYQWDWNADGNYDYNTSDPIAIYDYDDTNQHTVNLKVHDIENENDTILINSIKAIVNSPPIITVIYPNGGEILTNGELITWNTIDESTTNITIEYSNNNGSSWSFIVQNISDTGSYLWDTTTVSEGENYLIKITAIDNYNQIGIDQSDHVFSINNSVLIACFTWMDKDGIGPNTIIDFNATCSSDVPSREVIMYCWDWNNDNVFDFNSTNPYASYDWSDYQVHTVKLKVKDNSGISNIFIDDVHAIYDQPPVACFSWADADGIGASTSINFDASCSSDDINIIIYKWDWNNDGSIDYISTNPTASYDWQDTSTHEVKLIVNDTAGQSDSTINSSIKAYYNPSPLIENIQIIPSIQYTGKYVNISCTIADDDGVDQASINITNPSIIPINITMDNAENNYWYNTTYDIKGLYHFVIYARDTLGISSISQEHSFTIIEKIAPIADANGPYYANIDETIMFDGTASYDNDGMIVNWTWDFDDGSFGFGETVHHSYNSVNTYSVRLLVTDNDGLTDTTSTQVFIISNETADKIQNKFDYGFPLLESKLYAQSFIPSVNVLSKIELLIKKEGPVDKDLTVSIRDTLNGTNIITVTIPPENISEGYSWIVCNFSNLELESGMTYYIILNSPHSIFDSCNFYKWGCSYFTGYQDGSMWFAISDSFPWINVPLIDFCFKTYGYY